MTSLEIFKKIVHELKLMFILHGHDYLHSCQGRQLLAECELVLESMLLEVDPTLKLGDVLTTMIARNIIFVLIKNEAQVYQCSQTMLLERQFLHRISHDSFV
jgi:hypothetical protein